MERLCSPEAVEQQIRSIGFPVALHADGSSGMTDRYYIRNEERLHEQILHALAAAGTNQANGVFVLPFPNSRRMPVRPP